MSLDRGIQQLSSGLSATGGFGLPSELLLDFRRRVKLLALIFLVMCIVSIGTEWAIHARFTALHIVFVVNGLGSLAVYLVARREQLRHALVLNLALGFEVLMCAMVSLGFSYVEVSAGKELPYLNWTCIVIVMYPLIVPTPPGRTLVAAVASAATAPMAAAVMAGLGLTQVSLRDFIVVSISPVFCVAVAVLASRVVHGLSRDVADARKAGRYALVEEIGSGGMGEVWRAEHQLLARPAAVKLIRAESLETDDPELTQTLLTRFEHEVQATALLCSPHTVDVYDFGIADDGSFYYVMELLDGIDLQKLVDTHGPLPAERVLYLLDQACRSLEEAHHARLVHRDIKPANLIACRYGLELDFIKVLDFGLVKVVSGHQDSPTLTRSDSAVGTPSYMAPEMAVARATVDDRADIYSLGCVAYWLLTGTLVFQGESAMEVVVQHARDLPDSPASRTELPIPADLEELVMDCLEKDPVSRPESIAVLRQRLEAIELATAWTRERRERWWQTHRPSAS